MGGDPFDGITTPPPDRRRHPQESRQNHGADPAQNLELVGAPPTACWELGGGAKSEGGRILWEFFGGEERGDF